MVACLQDLPEELTKKIVSHFDGNSYLILSSVCKAWMHTIDSFGLRSFSIKAEGDVLRYMKEHILSSSRGRTLLANTSVVKFTTYNPCLMIDDRNDRDSAEEYDEPYSAIYEWIAMQDVLKPVHLTYEGIATSSLQHFMSSEICTDRLTSLTIAFEKIELFEWMEGILSKCSTTLERLIINGSLRDVHYSHAKPEDVPNFPKLRSLHLETMGSAKHQLLSHILDTSPIESLTCDRSQPGHFCQMILPLASQLIQLDCQYYLSQYGHMFPLLQSLGLWACLTEDVHDPVAPLPQQIKKLAVDLTQVDNEKLLNQIFEDPSYAPNLKYLVIKADRHFVFGDYREAVKDLLQSCTTRGLVLLWSSGEAVVPDEPTRIVPPQPYSERWRFKRALGLLTGPDAKYNNPHPLYVRRPSDESARIASPGAERKI